MSTCQYFYRVVFAFFLYKSTIWSSPICVDVFFFSFLHFAACFPRKRAITSQQFFRVLFAFFLYKSTVWSSCFLFYFSFILLFVSPENVRLLVNTLIAFFSLSFCTNLLFDRFAFSFFNFFLSSFRCLIHVRFLSFFVFFLYRYAVWSLTSILQTSIFHQVTSLWMTLNLTQLPFLFTLWPPRLNSLLSFWNPRLRSRLSLVLIARVKTCVAMELSV